MVGEYQSLFHLNREWNRQSTHWQVAYRRCGGINKQIDKWVGNQLDPISHPLLLLVGDYQLFHLNRERNRQLTHWQVASRRWRNRWANWRERIDEQVGNRQSTRSSAANCSNSSWIIISAVNTNSSFLPSHMCPRWVCAILTSSNFRLSASVNVWTVGVLSIAEQS